MTARSSRAVTRAGCVLHVAVHAEHPDILAMRHAHALHGSACASQGRPLVPITQDVCQFFEDHAVIREESGQVAVERGAGASIAPAFKGVRAALHRNHGLFTVSRHSIDAAAFMFMALERCCQQQLMAEASGHKPIEIAPDRARYGREHVGSDYTAWLCFQTDDDHLVRTRPYMFD